MKKQSAPVEECDVVIVGYGPGGQALAGLLARKGWRVIALERYPDLFNLPRAGHVDHEALRIVQGITDPRAYLKTLWEVREEYKWLNGKGEVIMLQPEHDTGDALSGYFSDFSQWQPNLERTLHEGAVAAGADIRFGWECVAFSQDEAGVRATLAATESGEDGLRQTGETAEIHARYLVGFDGANSFVRRALGIDRFDHEFDERWLVSDMEVISPIKFEPNIAQICDPARPRMLMPLGLHHRRFEWMLLPGEDTAEFEREETAWRLLAEFGVTPKNHRFARNIVYRFQARTAEQWRQGRILIGGDAAHTMPPFAGQGMLSAMRDSNNIAWKLDLVMRDDAPERLLDTYQKERRAHVDAWTRISMAEGRISCELDPARAAERDARLLAGEKLPAPRPPKITRGVVPGPDSAFAHPLAGTIGLQARVRAGNGEGLFDDVFGASRISLVTIAGTAGIRLGPDRLERLRQLGAVIVEMVPPGQDPGPGQAEDVDGRYRDYFASNGISAVLNRPDFTVFGAVSDLRNLGGLVDAFLARIEGIMNETTPQRLLIDGIRYAEAPRWHDGRLWFSDVHDYKLKAVDMDSRVEVIAEVPGRPSGLGFLPNGRPLLATALDRTLVTVADGRLRELADLSGLVQGVLNDMVVDDRGRAYIGDTGFVMGREAPRPGRVILWREGQPPRVVAEDVSFPNGCAVSPDGRIFYLAETFAKRISRFTILENGSLENRSVFAVLDAPPDGLCLDAEGGMWIGLPEAGRYVRLNSDGTLDRAIAGAYPFAVAPMLGGPDGRTLFLCSADTDLPRLSRGETTGRIDIADW